jgi:hypothetical protein
MVSTLPKIGDVKESPSSDRLNAACEDFSSKRALRRAGRSEVVVWCCSDSEALAISTAAPLQVHAEMDGVVVVGLSAEMFDTSGGWFFLFLFFFAYPTLSSRERI